MDRNELYHHGVLGMRWGVRRYQNKDGSLTNAGKKRRKGQAEEETTEQKRARLLKSSNAQELYDNRHLLSTNEINERLNRIDTEQRLARVAASTKKTGMDYVNKAISVYKKVDEAYSTVANSAVGKTLAKKLGIEVGSSKKEFDLNKVWKNRNKMSTKDLQDAVSRVKYEETLRKEMENRSTKKSKKPGENPEPETVEGTVYGEGTSEQSSKSTYKRPEEPTIIDVEEWRDVTDEDVSRGETYALSLINKRKKK